MSLGPFALISLFYLVIGARVVYQLARNFRQTFDKNFTREDRALVDQAAFFVLLPIAVALHELGHAVAIWAMGGDVLGWGFYGFAGYVAYNPFQFTDAQQVIIAAAGTAVNLALAAIAVGLVFLKRPPFRAAINELLIQFTWISLLNALLVYPVLDFVTGLNGDWMQMYDFSVPALSVAILVIHLAVLGLLFWAWKSPKARARIATLTGQSPERRTPGVAGGGGAAERTLREVAERVASGWPEPVEAAMRRGRQGTALILTWGNPSLRRSVIVGAPDAGGVELSGALQVAGQPPEQRALGRDPTAPDADRLTMTVRLAMETVQGWPVGAAAAPASAPHVAG